MSGFEDWLISVLRFSSFLLLIFLLISFRQRVPARVLQGLALHIFSMLLLSCCWMSI